MIVPSFMPLIHIGEIEGWSSASIDIATHEALEDEANCASASDVRFLLLDSLT